MFQMEFASFTKVHVSEGTQ